jgi:hypothetical protein
MLIIGASCAGHLENAEVAMPLVGKIRSMVLDPPSERFEATAPYVSKDDRKRLAVGLKLAGLN